MLTFNIKLSNQLFWKVFRLSSFVEVQEKAPTHTIWIERVGVRGIKRRVTVYSPLGPMTYDVRIDAYVDLPPNRRGVHLSRNIEAFLEAIDEARRGKYKSLEELFKAACNVLLEKHSYAERAEVRGETVYYFEDETFESKVPEAVDVAFKVVVERGGGEFWHVRVSLYGMTVCPSAQVTYSAFEGTDIEKSPSHTQRAKLSLEVKTKGRIARIEWLVQAVRASFSMPAISFLKRYHEHLLVKRAFENPKFVEDIVREALYNIALKLKSERFPLDSEITVEGESYESIHPHNAYAYRRGSLREILEETNYKTVIDSTSTHTS